VIDVEGSFDRSWAEAIGADPEKYVMAVADYGEQYLNIADSVIRADDCGLVVIDSLAALVPSVEMDGDAEDQHYALQARMIGRMVRKMKQRLIRERKRGHPCTVLFVNQMRVKIGQLYGSNETMSGGMQLRHEFSLLLRCAKASMSEREKTKYVDKSTGRNYAQKYSFSIRKEKVLTLAGTGEYFRVLRSKPSDGLTKGKIEDYNTLMKHAKEVGIVKSAGSSWYYFSHKAKKQEDIKTLWRKSWKEKVRTQQEIIKRTKRRMQDDAKEEANGQSEKG